MGAESCTTIPCHVMFTFLLLIISTWAATMHNSSTKSYKAYIKTSCNSTIYPSVCYTSLCPYAKKIKTNPQRLCKVAISVALKAAKQTSSLVSSMAKKGGLSPAETAVIKDCIEQIGDSIDELKECLNEVSNLGGPDLEFQMDTIKTKLSAAITDEETCIDELTETMVSPYVTDKIVNSTSNLVMLTSNSLALINHYPY